MKTDILDKVKEQTANRIISELENNSEIGSSIFSNPKTKKKIIDCIFAEIDKIMKQQYYVKKWEVHHIDQIEFLFAQFWEWGIDTATLVFIDINNMKGLNDEICKGGRTEADLHLSYVYSLLKSKFQYVFSKNESDEIVILSPEPFETTMVKLSQINEELTKYTLENGLRTKDLFPLSLRFVGGEIDIKIEGEFLDQARKRFERVFKIFDIINIIEKDDIKAIVEVWNSVFHNPQFDFKKITEKLWKPIHADIFPIDYFREKKRQLHKEESVVRQICTHIFLYCKQVSQNLQTLIREKRQTEFPSDINPHAVADHIIEKIGISRRKQVRAL